MRTVVLSDLHLGTRTRTDLAAHPEVRASIVHHVRGCDEVLLLGDVLELRDRPLDRALAAAAPFLSELGAAMGNGRVVLVPGNHDHHLVREAGGSGTAASVMQSIAAARRGPLGTIRGLLGRELVVAYPGWRVADGIWATHGHYLDAHSSAPTLECASAALVGLARRRPAGRARCPADYEAVLGPAYAVYHGIAQR